MYDFTTLNLDPKEIFSLIERKGNILICKEDLQFVFPSRFDAREFNTYDSAIRIIGIFAIVDTKGNYAVHNIPNRLTVTPNITDTVMIDNESHVVMTFYKGSIISPNVTMVKDTSFLNSLYNEFLVLGKVPKFFGYFDLLKTFKLTLKYNGSNVGKFNAPLQLLISLIARDAKDKSKQFRYTGLNGKPGEIQWVGLSNVHYAVETTLGKIGGGHAAQAIFSAIGNTSNEMSELEELLLT